MEINAHVGSVTMGKDPSIPGWVKAFALIALALVVLFVALHLAGLAPTGHGM
jgi:hypothetical protein